MSPDDPNRSKVEIIVKEVGRLEAILRMVLNYLQPLEFEASPTDLNDLVDAALEEVAQGFREASGAPRSSAWRLDLPEISLRPKVAGAGPGNSAHECSDANAEGSILTIRTSQKEEMLELVVRYPAPHLSDR